MYNIDKGCPISSTAQKKPLLGKTTQKYHFCTKNAKVPPGQEFHISPGGTIVRRSLADYETFVRGNITFNVERIQYRMFAVL